MTTVTIKEAKAKLAELIEQTPPGEAVVITRNDVPVAQLVPLPVTMPEPIFGSCRGMLTMLAEDDEHLADFAEYMR